MLFSNSFSSYHYSFVGQSDWISFTALSTYVNWWLNWKLDENWSSCLVFNLDWNPAFPVWLRRWPCPCLAMVICCTCTPLHMLASAGYGAPQRSEVCHRLQSSHSPLHPICQSSVAFIGLAEAPSLAHIYLEIHPRSGYFLSFWVYLN